MTSGFVLPGWTCPNRSACGIFNGEAKSARLVCRNCGAAKPETTEEVRLRRMADMYRAGKNLTEISKLEKLSRSRVGELLKKAGVTNGLRGRSKNWFA